MRQSFVLDLLHKNQQCQHAERIYFASSNISRNRNPHQSHAAHGCSAVYFAEVAAVFALPVFCPDAACPWLSILPQVSLHQLNMIFRSLTFDMLRQLGAHADLSRLKHDKRYAEDISDASVQPVHLAVTQLIARCHCMRSGMYVLLAQCKMRMSGYPGPVSCRKLDRSANIAPAKGPRRVSCTPIDSQNPVSTRNNHQLMPAACCGQPGHDS